MPSNGRYVLCANPKCDSVALTVVGEETFDSQADVFVGRQTCDVCETSMVYTRCPTREERMVMKRGKLARRPELPKRKTAPKMERNLTEPDIYPPKRKKTTHRVTTHKGGGNPSESAEVLPDLDDMQDAALRLGPIVLPDADGALLVLTEIAALNDRALRAQARYLALAEQTKDAKKTWEGYATSVQQKIKVATHASDLPLFSPEQAQHDLDSMTAGGETEDTAGEEMEDGDGAMSATDAINGEEPEGATNGDNGDDQAAGA